MNDDARTGIRPETPAGTQGEGAWGSDAIAQTLRALDIPYLALNPGASYRGLHDSLVNYLGNRAPQMLLCLHEESAVAIAQGYAKASDRMMGAVLHSNVGLMHASMAIFNAWCDRVPVLLLGATGPVGRDAPAPVDRLDPHRRGPGRAGARVHQVGLASPARCPALARRCCARRRSRAPRRAARPT